MSHLGTLYATCDNFMRIYFDGRLVKEDLNYGRDTRQWSRTSKVYIPAGTKVVGISCLDVGVAKGIIFRQREESLSMV